MPLTRQCGYPAHGERSAVRSDRAPAPDVERSSRASRQYRQRNVPAVFSRCGRYGVRLLCNVTQRNMGSGSCIINWPFGCTLSSYVVGSGVVQVKRTADGFACALLESPSDAVVCYHGHVTVRDIFSGCHSHRLGLRCRCHPRGQIVDGGSLM